MNENCSSCYKPRAKLKKSGVGAAETCVVKWDINVIEMIIINFTNMFKFKYICILCQICRIHIEIVEFAFLLSIYCLSWPPFWPMFQIMRFFVFSNVWLISATLLGYNIGVLNQSFLKFNLSLPNRRLLTLEWRN